MPTRGPAGKCARCWSIALYPSSCLSTDVSWTTRLASPGRTSLNAPPCVLNSVAGFVGPQKGVEDPNIHTAQICTAATSAAGNSGQQRHTSRRPGVDRLAMHPAALRSGPEGFWWHIGSLASSLPVSSSLGPVRCLAAASSAAGGRCCGMGSSDELLDLLRVEFESLLPRPDDVVADGRDGPSSSGSPVSATRPEREIIPSGERVGMVRAQHPQCSR